MTSRTTIQRFDPPGLPPVQGYSQVTVAQGSRIVHVSGQIGITADGQLAGSDHRSQFAQAMGNLVIALSAADATVDDLAKVTYYVVDYAPEVMGDLVSAAMEVFDGQPPVMAVTLVGVASLTDPNHLVEIEATAVTR